MNRRTAKSNAFGISLTWCPPPKRIISRLQMMGIMERLEYNGYDLQSGGVGLTKEETYAWWANIPVGGKYSGYGVIVRDKIVDSLYIPATGQILNRNGLPFDRKPEDGVKDESIELAFIGHSGPLKWHELHKWLALRVLVVVGPPLRVLAT